MAKFSEEQLKKLAKIALVAELDDNFEAIEVINSLVYMPNLEMPAATDGKYIAVNDDFFNFTVEEMYFIINHEFLHIYFNHVDRFLGKLGLDNYITNVATDLIINEMLVNEGQKMVEGGITRSNEEKEIGKKILGRTSKEVYYEIKNHYLKKIEEKKQQEEEAKKNPPKMIDPPRKPISSGQKSGALPHPNAKYKYAPGDYVKLRNGKIAKVTTAGEPDPKTGTQKITIQEIDEAEISKLNFIGLEKLNFAAVIQVTNNDVTPYYAPEQNNQNKQNNSDNSDNSDNLDNLDNLGNSDNSDNSIDFEALKEILSEKAKEYLDKIEKEAKAVKQMQANKDLTDEEKQERENAIERLKEKVTAKKMQASTRETKELERGYTPPVVNWKILLQKFLGKHLKRAEKRNYNRPNYRYDDIYGDSGLILPSTKGYRMTPLINVYLDVSGSMMLDKIIDPVREELTKARKFFKLYQAKYYEFDNDIIEFDKKSFFSRSGANNAGTNIRKVIAHFVQDKKAELCVLITDAGDEFQKELDVINKPLLLITNNTKISTNNPKVTLVITDFK